MSNTDKTEAIAQLQRAIRAIERAMQTLDEVYYQALVPEQRAIFKLSTKLNERLEAAEFFLRHIKAAEVTVKPPGTNSYKKLDKALVDLMAMQLETDSVKRILKVIGAVGDAVKSTREDVSARSV